MHLLEGETSTLYNSYYRVCSEHFEDRMYTNEQKKTLHEDAVPTLRLDETDYTSEVMEGIISYNIQQPSTSGNHDLKMQINLNYN